MYVSGKAWAGGDGRRARGEDPGSAPTISLLVCIFVGAGFIIYARLPRQQSHSLPMFCSRASILDTDLPAGTCDIVPTL